MKITLLTEYSVRLEPTDGPMTIEAPSAEQSYSPFHMLAGSLAYCTWSVLASWATHANLEAEDLTVDVSWQFAEDPYRVGAMDIHFAWPSLPAKRLNAAKRVAEMCTVHATLTHPPHIAIDGEAAAEGTEAKSADQQMAMHVHAAADAPASRAPARAELGTIGGDEEHPDAPADA
ncbi:MAG: OsmC family protein [Gemmatimonadetes bacterium]|nr:OsmC family protein [Gemmatimonadota bacterium]